MRTLEDLIGDLGGNGRAQVLTIVLVNLTRLSIGWSMMEMSFANFVPKWCCLPDNHTATPESYCHEDGDPNNSSFAKSCTLNTTSCGQRVFQTGITTVVNEWDLVCERKWIVPFFTSVQMFGVLVGATIAGQVADLWGRKKVLYMNSAGGAIFNIITTFSISWQMFVACRFMIGLTIGGFLAVGVPYTTEFVLPSKRAFVSLIPSFNIGTCLMALVAWRVHDWKMVHWIGGAMTVPLLLSYFFVPESLRWLAVRGRTEEAEQVITWIARLNKREVPKDYLDIIKNVGEQVKSSGTTTKYTYIHLYKGWRLFKSSVLLQLIWLISNMCSYGLSFGVSAFGGNVYLTIFLFAAVTLPGLAIVGPILDRVGRKKTGVCALILSAACGFASLAVRLTVSNEDTKSLLLNIANMMSRALQGAAFSAFMLSTTETYPTVIRALGFGAANVTARIGGMIAPFALNFEDDPNLAFAISGGAMLVSAIIFLFVDETMGKAMQDTTLKIVPDVDDKTLDVKQENGADKEVGNGHQTIHTKETD